MWLHIRVGVQMQGKGANVQRKTQEDHSSLVRGGSRLWHMIVMICGRSCVFEFFKSYI